VLEFFKYHGAGNDFIMIDNRSNTFTPEIGVVEFLCRRHFGISADGLILLENNAGGLLKMRYFNSDGKEATMCGNGGRCFVAFAKQLRLTDKSLTFSAIDGIHEAKIIATDRKSFTIKLKMNDVTQITTHPEGIFADTGSPHLVVFVNGIGNLDVVAKGRDLRTMDKWGKTGVNVNFAEVKDGRILSRTYERGVENETLACGTGAIAMALATAYKGLLTNTPIEIHALGGVLKVHFESGHNRFTNVWLEGPAAMVFRGEIEI